MFEIKYWSVFLIIVFLWIIIRVINFLRKKEFSVKHEAKMLLFLLGFVVIVRIVYFPWHHVNGEIGTLKFDGSRILPLWVNFLPIVHMFDSYDGWLMNIIGNITMFIPIGIFEWLVMSSDGRWLLVSPTCRSRNRHNGSSEYPQVFLAS